MKTKQNPKIWYKYLNLFEILKIVREQIFKLNLSTK